MTLVPQFAPASGHAPVGGDESVLGRRGLVSALTNGSASKAIRARRSLTSTSAIPSAVTNDGVEIKLGNLRSVLGQPTQSLHQVPERGGVAGREPAVSAQQGCDTESTHEPKQGSRGDVGERVRAYRAEQGLHAASTCSAPTTLVKLAFIPAKDASPASSVLPEERTATAVSVPS